MPRTTAEPHFYDRREKERYPARTTPAGENRADQDNREPPGRRLVPDTRKPSKTKPTKRKNGGEKVTKRVGVGSRFYLVLENTTVPKNSLEDVCD